MVPVQTGAKAQWLYAVVRIRQGKLPSGFAAWPAEAAQLAEATMAAAAGAAQALDEGGGVEEPPSKKEKKQRRCYLREEAEALRVALPMSAWLQQLRRPHSSGEAAQRASEAVSE